MTFSSKMIGRITGVKASDTHTVGAVGARNNESLGNMGANHSARRALGAGSRIGAYESSLIGQKRGVYPKTLNAEQMNARREARLSNRYSKSYDQATNASPSAGRQGLGMRSSGVRRFNDAGVGSLQSRANSGTNAAAKPALKPNFRRPF